MLLPMQAEPIAASPFKYREIEVEGWSVLVQQELYDHAELRPRVLACLTIKLWEVARRLPAPVVKRLQKVKIRMHLNREGCPGGVYHPSPEWLRDHQLPPEWGRGIEFGNARNFLDWSMQQPAMVLHELAHAWEHQVIDAEQRREIQAVLDATIESKQLEQSLYVTGGRNRAYALNNLQEFFAEMSEAWWWTNDIFPFVRGEILDDFPEVVRLMESCWQAPPD